MSQKICNVNVSIGTIKRSQNNIGLCGRRQRRKPLWNLKHKYFFLICNRRIKIRIQFWGRTKQKSAWLFVIVRPGFIESEYIRNTQQRKNYPASDSTDKDRRIDKESLKTTTVCLPYVKGVSEKDMWVHTTTEKYSGVQTYEDISAMSDLNIGEYDQVFFVSQSLPLQQRIKR